MESPLYKIIKKLSGYLKLDIIYFTDKGKYLLFSHIITIIMHFLLSIVLARSLSEIVYGQYNFIFSIVGTLLVFTLPGINSALTIASAQRKDGFYLQAFKSKLKASILGVLILIGISIYFFITNDVHLVLPILIAALFFIPAYVFLAYFYFLNGKKYFKKYSLYAILVEAIPILVTIVIALLFKNLTLIIFGWFAVTSFLNIYFFKKSLKLRKNNIEDKKLLSYGKHLTLINFISDLLIKVDSLLITYFLGFGDLAIYVIAEVFPTQLKNLLKAVGIPLISPDFSRLDKKVLYKKIMSKLIFILLSAVLFSLIGMLLVPYLITLFYGAKYVSSIFYARLLFLSMIFALPYLLITFGILIPQKKRKEVWVINNLTPLSNIFFLFILIPKFGLLGAVLSRIFSRFFGFVLSLMALFRLKK